MNRDMEIRQIIAGVFFGVLLMAAPAQANDVHKILEQARQGAATAQLQVGDSYYKGENLRQDFLKAALWYRRAAEQGTATAQYSLGVMFAEGKGLPQSYVEGYGWVSLAHEQGFGRAEGMLGKLRKVMKEEELALAEEKAKHLKNRILH